MSDIDEAGRALIALASDAHDPTDADRARVRAALAARLGAAAGLGLGTVAGLTATAKAAASVAGSAGATAACGAAGAALTTTKLIGLALVVTTTLGVGTGVTIHLSRRSAHVPAPAQTTVAHRDRTPPAAPRALPPPAGEQPTPEERSSNVAPVQRARPPEGERALGKDAHDAIGTGSRRRSPNAGDTADHASVPAPSSPEVAARRSESSVAEEARLVNEGVRALRAGQPSAALALFDTHARLHPDGVLAEERDAERALALADLGRVAEARAAASAFLRRHPTSPLGVRLRQRIPGLDGAGNASEMPTRGRLP